jgi:hypothetical protein
MQKDSACGGIEAEAVGMDALELSRNSRPVHYADRSVI